MRKLSYEYVVKYFEDRNCKLLSLDYNNNHEFLDYICYCGNQSKIAFNNFKKGQRCKNHVHNPRLSLEYAQKYFSDRNCTLHALEYINNDTSMSFTCECGNDSQITFGNFQQGGRCRSCSMKRRGSYAGSNNPNWNPNRDYVELIKLIKRKCFAALHSTLDSIGSKKENKTYQLLGFTPKDLLKHLESFPSWPILKNTKWHLDHIFPIKAFVDYGFIDISLINSLDNLQPLSEKANLEKGDYCDKIEFEKWLAQKGINYAFI